VGEKKIKTQKEMKKKKSSFNIFCSHIHRNLKTCRQTQKAEINIYIYIYITKGEKRETLDGISEFLTILGWRRNNLWYPESSHFFLPRIFTVNKQSLIKKWGVF
jgi:hypothetical protein